MPVNDQPMACAGSMAGEPGRVSRRGDRRTAIRGDWAASLRCQLGIMPWRILVDSYSCSVYVSGSQMPFAFWSSATSM